MNGHGAFQIAMKLFSHVDLKESDVADLFWSEEISGFRSVGCGAVPLSSGDNDFDTQVFAAESTFMAICMDIPGTVTLYEMPGMVSHGDVPVNVIGQYGYLILTAPKATHYLRVNVSAAGKMRIAFFGDFSS